LLFPESFAKQTLKSADRLAELFAQGHYWFLVHTENRLQVTDVQPHYRQTLNLKGHVKDASETTCRNTRVAPFVCNTSVTWVQT
jgi:hypothetical protein